MQSDERITLHKEVVEIACEEYLACLFLKQADEGRFGNLKTILVNGHLNPNALDYHYPKTLQDSLCLLNSLMGKGADMRPFLN